MEEWRDIKGYEGLYQVSNMGRVKRLPSQIQMPAGGTRYYKGGILKPRHSSPGWRYYSVCLSKNGKVQSFSIHRLVAIAFIPNPEGKPRVNHIDENIYNNCVDNLEWVTPWENITAGTVQERISKGYGKSRKKVYQYDKEGNFIREHDGCISCEQFGFNAHEVSRCCTGKKKSHKGFVFSYVKHGMHAE